MLSRADPCVREGCCAFGVDVDIELHGFDGIFISYDTMEGLSLDLLYLAASLTQCRVNYLLRMMLHH